MDPCGAFVDLIRRPYTTKCRFFRDSNLEVDISWYPCKPEAPAIDTPTVISSLDWWVQERELGVFSGYKVGEVPGATRKFNGLKLKPGADGTHRCGTPEEWADGAAFDPTVNRIKRKDGLPTCCGGVPMGIVVGGTGVFTPPDIRGVVMGGTAAVGTVLAVPNCDDGPMGTLPADGTVTWVRTNPIGSPYTSLTVWPQVHGFGFSVRGAFLGAIPGGTVKLVRARLGLSCRLGDVLYSGPSDVPFSFECPDAPAPLFGYYITVDTGPSPVGSFLCFSEQYIP